MMVTKYLSQSLRDSQIKYYGAKNTNPSLFMYKDVSNVVISVLSTKCRHLKLSTVIVDFLKIHLRNEERRSRMGESFKDVEDGK